MSICEKLQLAIDVIKKCDLEKDVLNVVIAHTDKVEILINNENTLLELEGVKTVSYEGNMFNNKTFVFIDGVEIYSYHN
ncbi:hypothetical protein I6G82_02495 [Lysinibacillus macroides]|uniref:Uncharacterized protein n=1 Tax=Lysinibacillus macroides TaxID=33935 RepID=A0A0N0CVG1_9BACI|nr:hypothetical protein [Lysinibacillus macroides]KOY81314.1 hypothetical protein ADM90_19475 [Lysinibacillus macroides]QPR68521.1 hypothetical protein I6G82_02495 [Lysinibacillus macroides]